MLIEPSAACCLVTLSACCAPGASVLAISEMGGSSPNSSERLPSIVGLSSRSFARLPLPHLLDLFHGLNEVVARRVLQRRELNVGLSSFSHSCWPTGSMFV